jgi:hypothetical protein
MGLRSIRDLARVLCVFVHSELSVGCSEFAAQIKTAFLSTLFVRASSSTSDGGVGGGS